MRIGIISGVIGLFVTLSVHAQKSDSIKSMLLPDVVVTETYQQRQAKKSALTVDVADQDFLRKHFTGNFMQAMENILVCRVLREKVVVLIYKAYISSPELGELLIRKLRASAVYVRSANLYRALIRNIERSKYP